MANTRKYPLELEIPAEEWLKLLGYAKAAGNTETGGVARLEDVDGVLIVRDVLLMPQTASMGEVVIDPTAVHNWLVEQFGSPKVNCAQPRLKFVLWHTHGMGAPFFSAQDDRWIHEMVTWDFMASICLNTAGDWESRIDALVGGTNEATGLWMAIDHNATVTHAQTATILEACKKEYEDKVKSDVVKKKTYAMQSASKYNPTPRTRDSITGRELSETRSSRTKPKSAGKGKDKNNSKGFRTTDKRGTHTLPPQAGLINHTAAARGGGTTPATAVDLNTQTVSGVRATTNGRTELAASAKGAKNLNPSVALNAMRKTLVAATYHLSNAVREDIALLKEWPQESGVSVARYIMDMDGILTKRNASQLAALGDEAPARLRELRKGEVGKLDAAYQKILNSKLDVIMIFHRKGHIYLSIAKKRFILLPTKMAARIIGLRIERSATDVEIMFRSGLLIKDTAANENATPYREFRLLPPGKEESYASASA